MYEINLLLNYAMKFFTLLLHRVSSNLRGVLGFVQESYRNFSKIHVYIFYRHFTVIVLEKNQPETWGWLPPQLPWLCPCHVYCDLQAN